MSVSGELVAIAVWLAGSVWATWRVVAPTPALVQALTDSIAEESEPDLAMGCRMYRVIVRERGK